MVTIVGSRVNMKRGGSSQLERNSPDLRGSMQQGFTSATFQHLTCSTRLAAAP